jgi:hypothetical protein
MAFDVVPKNEGGTQSKAMRLTRDILVGLVAGFSLGLAFAYLAYLIPELWEHFESRSFDRMEIGDDFTGAVDVMTEEPGVPILFGAHFATGWILWRVFRAVERKFRRSTTSRQMPAQQDEDGKASPAIS